jgi:hypothetical protein
MPNAALCAWLLDQAGTASGIHLTAHQRAELCHPRGAGGVRTPKPFDLMHSSLRQAARIVQFLLIGGRISL